MGPPSRSLSPDAHDCIMVEILRSHRIQGCDGFARTEDSSPSRSLPAPARSDPACTTVECEEGGQTEQLERYAAEDCGRDRVCRVHCQGGGKRNGHPIASANWDR